jgi:pyruvate/2-oxoglutarate dehydrogenase complex dihydrolipoamide acyltransferase (E2) component
MNLNECATAAPMRGEPLRQQSDAVRDLLEREKQSLSSAVSGAAGRVTKEARKLAHEAEQAATAQINKAKDAANTHLGSFAGAFHRQPPPCRPASPKQGSG